MLDCGHEQTTKCYDCCRSDGELRYDANRKLMGKDVVPHYVKDAEGRRFGAWYCPDGHEVRFYNDQGQKVYSNLSDHWDRAYLKAKGIKLDSPTEKWSYRFIKVCDACFKAMPSARIKVLQEPLRKAQKELQEAEAARVRMQEWIDEHGEGTFDVCPHCHEVVEMTVQVRQCSKESCNDHNFNGDDNGRNCDECNSPFSRKLSEKGHEDCIDQWEDGDEVTPTVFSNEKYAELTAAIPPLEEIVKVEEAKFEKAKEELLREGR